MLSVSELACTRGDRRLFAGVSLALNRGEWLHLQGDNGSGKTSLLRIVCGLSPAAQGQVRWDGVGINDASSEFRRELFYLGHSLALKDELSALENLHADAAIAGRALTHDAAMAALARLGLAGREKLPVRVLSQGQKRRAALARLLASQAALWVLDEPFVALDGPAQLALNDVVRQHIASGGMVLLTSHQPVELGSVGHAYRLH